MINLTGALILLLFVNRVISDEMKFMTKEGEDYAFFPLSTCALHIRVKSSTPVEFIFTPDPSVESEMGPLFMVMGAQFNTITAVRPVNRPGLLQEPKSTPNILNATDFKSYFITLYGHDFKDIALYTDGGTPIFTFIDDYEICNGFGVRSGMGKPAQWIYDEILRTNFKIQMIPILFQDWFLIRGNFSARTNDPIVFVILDTIKIELSSNIQITLTNEMSTLLYRTDDRRTDSTVYQDVLGSVEVESPDILSDSKFSDFWYEWDEGKKRLLFGSGPKILFDYVLPVLPDFPLRFSRVYLYSVNDTYTEWKVSTKADTVFPRRKQIDECKSVSGLVSCSAKIKTSDANFTKADTKKICEICKLMSNATKTKGPKKNPKKKFA